MFSASRKRPRSHSPLRGNPLPIGRRFCGYSHYSEYTGVMIATRNQDKKKSKGRPTVADARRLSKAVTVKFSKIDYETLRTKSRKANRRLAEYIRESALQSEVVQPRTEADLKEYRTLVGMANNLNQLTKMAHQDSIIYLYSPIDRLLGEITSVIREYKQGTNQKKK